MLFSMPRIQLCTLGFLLISLWASEFAKFKICNNLTITERLTISNIFNKMRNFVNEKSREIHFYPLNYLENLSFMDIPHEDIMIVERNGTDFKTILQELYKLEEKEGDVNDSFYQTVKLQLFNSVECQLCSDQASNQNITLICQFAYLKSVDQEETETVPMSTATVYDKKPRENMIVQEKVRPIYESPNLISITEAPIPTPVADPDPLSITDITKISRPKDREYYPIATVISKRTTYYLEGDGLELNDGSDDGQERSRKNSDHVTLVYNDTEFMRTLNDSLLDESVFNATANDKEKKMVEVIKVVASIASVGVAVLLICCAYCMCCKGEDENNQQNQQGQ